MYEELDGAGGSDRDSKGARSAASVAVIIPTYNHARYLAGALDSAFSQTVPPREVIVVDDGSHDDPAEVVSRHPEARIIRQANQGLSAARNTGWRASDSEMLVFLDADDRLKPEAIELNLKLFDAVPDCGLVYGAYVYVFPATGQEQIVPVREPGPDPYADFLRGNRIGMHGTVMYRRAVLETLGGFDESLAACEDYDLYLRAVQHFPIASQPAVLAEYTRHDQNMSRNSGRMLKTALAALRKQRSHARQRPEWRQAYKEGAAEWARFYANDWRMSILQASTAKDVVQLLGQALTMMRLAPTAIPADLLGRLAGRYERRRTRRRT